MGSRTKLVLASTMAIAMVLAFAVGFWPSPSNVGATAAVDGKLNVASLLNRVLRLEKQALVSITFPPNGSIVKIPASSAEANLTVKVQSTGESVAVASGGYSLTPGAFNWGFGTLFGIDNAAPFEVNANLASLSAGQNTLTAYANATLLSGQTAQFSYESTASTSFTLDKLEVNPDTDSNGLPDNPFATVTPGVVWVSQNEAGATVIVVNLSPATKQAGTLDPVVIDNISVTPPTLAALMAADNNYSELSNATSGLLIVEAAPDLLSLLNSADWAYRLYDRLPPNELITVGETLNQYAEISIVYEYDGGASFDEVDELPEGTTVELTWSGLDADDNTSAIFFSVDTLIDDSFDATEVADAGWEKKNNATTVASGSATVQLDTLSLFAPFASAFSVTSVTPNAGPTAGGNFASVNGSYPVDSVITTIEAAEAAYAVYFGDPSVASRKADFAVNPDTSNVVTAGSMYVTVPAAPVAKQSSATVDVYVTAADDVNDFGVLMNGYTYAPQPDLVAVNPDSGSIVGGDTVTLTGNGLLTANAVFFGGTAAAIQTVTDNSIVVTTPAHAAGVVDVQVVTAGGQDTLAAAFTYGAVPVANFSADLIEAEVNQNIQFTDLSTNTPTSWAWDFDNDGTVDSLVQNPTFAYPASGTYTVSLTATNDFGSDTETKVDYIVVSTIVLVVTDFTATPTTGDAPLNVQFTDTSTGNPTVWQWDFQNDGTVDSTEQNPSFVYQDPGVYTVALTASNANNSDTETKVDFITVTTPDLYIDDITPNNAWAFGGVVARIDGVGFTTTTLGGDVTVMFGNVEANVLQASDTELFVEVPAQTFSGAQSVVDITVTRVDGTTNTFTKDDLFTYVNYIDRNENFDGGAFHTVTSTAATLTGGTGAVSLVLDADVPATAATLTVPAGVVKQGTDRFVLGRATKVASAFGHNGLITAGSAITFIWNFDLHVYESIVPTAPFTPGMPTLQEVELTYDRESDATPATLTFPTGDTELTTTEIADGMVAMYSLESDLLYGSPLAAFDDANYSVAGPQQFQSQPYNTEFVANGTAVTQVTSRLYSLSTFELRTDVVVDLEALNPMIVVDDEFSDEGPKRGGTNVAIEGDGGLGYIDRIVFVESATGKQLAEVEADVQTAEGTDEFRVEMITGAFPKTITQPTPVDIQIFLQGDPDNAAAVLPAAFTYLPPRINLLTILLGLLGLAGLVAGGDSGGGGGGPCFIATAAYGTPMADQIDTLRAVRDTYLLDTAAGSALVDTYYRVSPAIADVVAKSPVLAAAVRLMLMPVILLAKVVLALPHVSFLLMALAMAVPYLRRRARKA